MINQLAKITVSPTITLLAVDSENDIKQIARKLMHLTPGGKNLDSAQAADLAVFAFATGLNPFNNECYYMDKIGPVPGIAGYRTKAQEWITATSHRLDYAVRLTEDYRQATTDEADFDPDKGDVAWVCILTDNVSKLQWEQRLVTLMSDYRKLGATFEESRKAAKEDVGACPSWTAVGVVHADEHFSGFLWENNIKTDKYKPEAWDRNERAKKRAAKGCYRKGFPQVRIPDREYGDDVVDSVAVEVKDRLIKDLALEAEKPHRPAADVIAELYCETPVQKEQPATEVKAEYITPEPEFAEVPVGFETQSEQPATASVEAYALDEQGHPYDEMQTPQVLGHLNSLAKRKNPADAERITYLRKLLAARQAK